MKLDSDQVFCHGPVGHKPDSKHFEYSDNTLDSIGLKPGKGIEKQNEKGVLKRKEGDTNQQPYLINNEDGWTARKLDCAMSVEDLTHDDEKQIRDFLAPILPSHSTKMESFEKDSVFYMDKNVMEHELPELIICYNEHTDHVVKDICIDEGMCSRDKFLFETNTNAKSMCSYLPAEIKSDMVKEKFELDMPGSDVLKLTSEKENDLDLPMPDWLKKSAEEKGSICVASSECDPKDSMMTGEIGLCATEKIENDTSKEIFSFRDLLLMPELGEKFSHAKSSDNSFDKVERQPLQRPSENPVLVAGSWEDSENVRMGEALASPTLASAAEESEYDHEEAVLAVRALKTSELVGHDHEEAVLASPASISAAEVSDKAHSRDSVSEESSGRIVDEFSYNRSMETRSITLDFDNSAPTGSGREGCSQNNDPECLGTQNSDRPEDPNVNPMLSQLQFFPGESSFSLAGPSQLQYVPGESSFSAAGPSSGLITYSGPITYSGSLSLRSDSSTTSTRSFAFPVLQAEWNSSPVRMAKAERRRCWKHRGWRQGLLCCRF